MYAVLRVDPSLCMGVAVLLRCGVHANTDLLVVLDCRAAAAPVMAAAVAEASSAALDVVLCTDLASNTATNKSSKVSKSCPWSEKVDRKALDCATDNGVQTAQAAAATHRPNKRATGDHLIGCANDTAGAAASCTAGRLGAAVT